MVLYLQLFPLVMNLIVFNTELMSIGTFIKEKLKKDNKIALYMKKQKKEILWEYMRKTEEM